MINIFKNSILFGLIISLFTQVNVFSQSNFNFVSDMENTHNKSEIIYLIDDNGDLIRLNNEMSDFVPEDLKNISYIDVSGNDFIALTNYGELISSFDFKIPKGSKVKKIDKTFVLTDDGEVYSYNYKISRFLRGIKKAEDIKALSDEIVMVKHDDYTVSILGNGDNGIKTIKNLQGVVDAVSYYDKLVFVIKGDGRIEVFGDGYEDVKEVALKVLNGKKFILANENLYVVTFDDVAIPLIEKGFKAPKEYLNGISNIVIDKFSSGENYLYKAYFVKNDGKLIYHIQSDNEISDFNKDKMKYISTFDNVQDVYESGYLTIVLHKDGSITIPYDIDHELNGITGVRNVDLKNQSYVVYLNDGQVITSLDNFILNKKEIDKSNAGLSLYNYLNGIIITLLNRGISINEFEFLKHYLYNNVDNLKAFIKYLALNRKFLMLDNSYEEIGNIFYKCILNTFPSDDEFNHIKFVIEKMTSEGKNKKDIISAILDYVFENIIFENTLNEIYNS